MISGVVIAILAIAGLILDSSGLFRTDNTAGGRGSQASDVRSQGPIPGANAGSGTNTATATATGTSGGTPQPSGSSTATADATTSGTANNPQGGATTDPAKAPPAAPHTSAAPSNPKPTTPGYGTPAGPGSDSNFVPGSQTSVTGCTAWFSNAGTYQLYGKVSAGNVTCQATITPSGSMSYSSTSTIAASDDKVTTSASYPNEMVVGYYTMTIQICVKNESSGAQSCSATFKDDYGTMSED